MEDVIDPASEEVIDSEVDPDEAKDRISCSHSGQADCNPVEDQVRRRSAGYA